MIQNKEDGNGADSGRISCAPIHNSFPSHRMFSRVCVKACPKRLSLSSLGGVRSFAETGKKESKNSNLRLYLVLAVSGPVLYGGYAYATDKWFHEMVDTRFLHYTPWVMKMMNKWFPIEIASPFALRVSEPSSSD